MVPYSTGTGALYYALKNAIRAIYSLPAVRCEVTGLLREEFGAIRNTTISLNMLPWLLGFIRIEIPRSRKFGNAYSLDDKQPLLGHVL